MKKPENSGGWLFFATELKSYERRKFHKIMRDTYKHGTDENCFYL